MSEETDVERLFSNKRDGGLQSRVDFLVEIDRLKVVERRTVLVGHSRRENSAEHSWHVATCAVVLAPYAAEEIDLSRVLRILLVHDIVEIDAGDTFAYDEEARRHQRDRELAASNRLFGILPAAQAGEIASLWEEFEACQTAEAKFANAVDRFIPLLHNYYTGGASWREHGVTQDQVVQRMACIKDGAPALWPYVTALLSDAVAKGYLAP